MATLILTIRGDQLGTFSSMSGSGNGTGRVVTLSGAKPYGTAEQIFTIRIEQVSTGATQFTNGQFVTILNQSGKVVMARTTAQPDIEQGLGAGDEHIIFPSGRFVIDLAGVTPGKLTYRNVDEAAALDRGDNDGNLDFADTRRDFPCFATGTLIQTPQGPRPVQDLTAGDLVTDAAGRAHRLLWAASRAITLDRPDHPQRPILFRPGSLSCGGPETDLLVSPQHRMLVRDGLGAEVLVPAKSLLGQQGVRRALGLASVTYHALLLPRHAVLLVNGAAAESLYPGAHILRQLPVLQRLQVISHCPALLNDPVNGYGPTARPVLSVRVAREVYVASAAAA